MPQMVDCSGIPIIPAGCTYNEADQPKHLPRGLVDIQTPSWLCPSHVLDHRLATQDFPEEWKIDEHIFGSVFRRSDGWLVHRAVFFLDGEWRTRPA